MKFISGYEYSLHFIAIRVCFPWSMLLMFFKKRCCCRCCCICTFGTEYHSRCCCVGTLLTRYCCKCCCSYTGDRVPLEMRWLFCSFCTLEQTTVACRIRVYAGVISIYGLCLVRMESPQETNAASGRSRL